MDPGRFVAAAAAEGIEPTRSLALYTRLYGAPEPGWAPLPSAADATPAPAALSQQAPGQPVRDAPLPTYQTSTAPVPAGACTGALSRPAAGFGEQDQLTRVVQVLVWLGVLLVIGAHAWWSTSGYESLGYGIVLFLTLLWQVAFLAAAEWARRAGHGSLEAGFAAVVAFYTPLSVYSIERLAGASFETNEFRDFYPWISGGWVWMEVAAIAAAVVLLRRYRRPFVMLPLSMFVGFMLMDLTARLTGSGGDEWDTIERVVLVGGVVMVLAAVVLDLRGWRRFAFWPHLVGIWLIAWGIPLFLDGARWSLYLTAAILLALGTWLARVVYLVGGGLMAWTAVSMSARGALFPFALMGGGIAFIGLAIWLTQSHSPVRRWLAERQPSVPQRDLDY